jgi:2-polyprenyl-3-methyl-5-hydroxy-6-metoxy-1,4-benzoquinol methylase
MGRRRPDPHGVATPRSARRQVEHPLVGADVDSGSAADYVLRLIHLKAYADGASRAIGRTILDIGCNDGYGTVLLAATARRTTGIDVSPAAISAARRRPEATGIDFRVVDGDQLPFPDHSFDVVTAFQVIEHITDVGPFLAEVRRVTAPGGTVVFTTPNAAIRLDPGMAPWNPFHVREYTAEELRHELSQLGATIRVRGLFGPPPVARTEVARAAAARDRARHPRPWPVRVAIGLLPEAARNRLRSLRGRTEPADPFSVRSFGVDDLWYADVELDVALDLQAVCAVAPQRDPST